jgi:hypothetical protein
LLLLLLAVAEGGVDADALVDLKTGEVCQYRSHITSNQGGLEGQVWHSGDRGWLGLTVNDQQLAGPGGPLPLGWSGREEDDNTRRIGLVEDAAYVSALVNFDHICWLLGGFG